MRKQRVILSVALFLSAGFALCYVMFFIVFSPDEVVSFGYHQAGYIQRRAECYQDAETNGRDVR